MRAIDAAGFTALTLGLGSLIVGHGLVLPGLEHAPGVGPNLARGARAVATANLGNVMLVAWITLAIIAPRLTGRSWTGLLGLSLVGLGVLHRVWVAPEAFELLARVDLTTQRPAMRYERAAALLRHDHFLLWTTAILALWLAALWLSKRTSDDLRCGAAEPAAAPVPGADPTLA